MFKCKICKEKDERISELKDQITYFKSLLNPAPRINKFELQEDLLLEGGGQETDPTPVDEEAERIENERIQRESDFIFSTNFEQAE